MARRLLLSLLLIGGTITLLALPASTAFAARIPVNIESVPAGATVYLDSTSNPPLGTTPLANVRVETGAHTIIFQLANHEEARLQVTVRRRRETFRAVLRALGTVEVSAGNAAAQGAQVLVDGRPLGTLGPTPIRVTDLQPGRHQVSVQRDGHDTFEQWVEVGGGQLVRIAAILQQSAPDTGEILVSGPPGSPVYLDGAPRGVLPTVLEGVSVGGHSVEIRAPGQPPFSQTVTVLAGQRATVAMPTASGGTLRVLTSAPGAVISVDGEVLGPSPATREGLAPGEHIVEATAEGYERARQTVTVESGQQRVISLDMTAVQGAAGRIVIESNVDGAFVIVDNEDRGQAPVVLTPEPGPHAIVVRADGHQEYSTTCETAPGQNCEIEAVLVPMQVRVSVAVQPGLRDAELYVDDELAGPVPFDGTLPAGSHVITVRAPGYQEFRQQVLLQPSDDVRPFDVTLPSIQDGITDDERQRLAQEDERRRGASVTHAAAPLPVNQAAMDLSLGWPYLAEIRLNVGLLDWLDAGFAIRSFGRLTEFEGRVRAGYRVLEQLGVGGQVRFGGGIGPELGHRSPDYPQIMDPMTGTPRAPLPSERFDVAPTTPTMGMEYGYPVNSAFLSLEAMGSLYFGDQGAFTLWIAADFSSDEYAGHPLNSGTYLDYYPGDSDGDGMLNDRYCAVNATTSDLECPREDFARARLGGALELVLTRNWNLSFLLEGILSSQPRRIMGNLLGIQANDTQFYFRIGTTYKF